MWMMIVTLKIYMLKITSGGFKEGGGWNIWGKHLRVNSHMIAPMKKGSYGKLFTMLFYIHVGTC